MRRFSNLTKIPHNIPSMWTHFLTCPPSIDISSSNIIIFPGFGSHYAGMGASLEKYPESKNIIEQSSEILGQNLINLWHKGPISKLSDPEIAFPSLITASIAKAAHLSRIKPEIIENCILATGFSDGELSALVFSGAIPLDIAIKYSRLQGKMVKKFSSKRIRMITIHFDHTSKVKEAISYVNNKFNDQEGKLRICIYLTSNFKVLSGDISHIKELNNVAKDFNILGMKILNYPVSIHTRTLKPVSRILQKFLSKYENQIIDTSIPVVSNELAEPYTNKRQILNRFPFQMSMPLKWEQLVHAILSRPADSDFPSIYEINHNKNIAKTIEIINKKAFDKYNLIEF